MDGRTFLDGWLSTYILYISMYIFILSKGGGWWYSVSFPGVAGVPWVAGCVTAVTLQLGFRVQFGLGIHNGLD